MYPRLCRRNRHPGQRARSSRIQVFNWNVGGLSGDVFESLQLFLTQENIQVATIQETHWPFCSEWLTDGFLGVHTGCLKHGVGGCLTMVSRQLCSQDKLRYHAVVPGRLLHVCFPVDDTVAHVVNLYQHYQLVGPGGLERAGGGSEHRADVWHRLDQLLASISFRHIIVLAGDFNSKLSPCSGHVGPAVGQASRESEHELLSLLVTHQLTCLNTRGRQSSYTCMGPSGATSVIDHVIIRLGQADERARAVKHLYQHPFTGQHHTYHVPLLATIPLLWQCWSKSKKMESCELDTDRFLTDVACQNNRYRLFLRQVQLEIDKLANDELDLDIAVAKAAISLYSSESCTAKISTILRHQVIRGWELWKQLQRIKSRTLLCLFNAWVLVRTLSVACPQI